MNRLILLTFLSTILSISLFAQASGDTVELDQSSMTDTGSSHFTDVTYTTVPKNNAVKLQWKIDSVGQGDYFILERSYDESFFETVGALKITDSVLNYELTDNSISAAAAFYRIRYTGKNGSSVFSKTVRVKLTADLEFKFYPNPADKVLIIQTEHDADMQLMDASGNVWISKKLQRGLQIINVATLEKGSYILRIADPETNKIISERLLKN